MVGENKKRMTNKTEKSKMTFVILSVSFALLALVVFFVMSYKQLYNKISCFFVCFGFWGITNVLLLKKKKITRETTTKINILLCVFLFVTFLFLLHLLNR